MGDLFVDTSDITYVFNQGRCYQQNHRWEEALDRFDEFLRKATDLSSSERADVDRYVADCKAHLPATQAAAPVPSTPPPAAAPSAAGGLPAAPSVVPLAGAVTVVESTGLSDQVARPGAGLRTAGIVVGAVGVASVVAGVVMAAKTQSLVDGMYSNGYDPSKESSRKSYETWGWVSYGVGAAGIVAGATMYVLGWSAGKSSPSSTRLSFLPAVGPGGARLIVQGGIQ